MAVFAQTDGGTGAVDSTSTPTQEVPAQISPAPASAVRPNVAPTVTATQPPAPAPTQPAPTASSSPSATNAAPDPTASAPAPEPASLEDVQGAVEEIAEYAPEPIQPVLAAVAGALGGIVFMLGLWEFLKRLRRRGKKECDRCGGTGTQSADEKCGLCGGTKKIEKEIEVTIACAHCKGSGTDPCHHCGGTGKMSEPNPPQSQEELEGWPPCDFCGGSGKKKVGAGRDWGEASDAVKGDFACCFCQGKKTETFTQKVQVDCPLCVRK